MVIVRYSKWALLSCVTPVALLLLIGSMLNALGADSLAYLFWVLTLPIILFGLARLLDRRPLMTIMPEGIALHVADEVFLTYDQIEYWIEDRHVSHRRWATFSIQFKPRFPLSIEIWARLNNITTNTLLDGDICFDDSLLDCDASDIAAACERFAASELERNAPLRKF